MLVQASCARQALPRVTLPSPPIIERVAGACGAAYRASPAPSGRYAPTTRRTSCCACCATTPRRHGGGGMRALAREGGAATHASRRPVPCSASTPTRPSRGRGSSTRGRSPRPTRPSSSVRVVGEGEGRRGEGREASTSRPLAPSPHGSPAAPLRALPVAQARRHPCHLRGSPRGAAGARQEGALLPLLLLRGGLCCLWHPLRVPAPASAPAAGVALLCDELRGPPQRP